MNVGGQQFEKKRRVAWTRSRKEKKSNSTIAFLEKAITGKRRLQNDASRGRDQISKQGIKACSLGTKYMAQSVKSLLNTMKT